MKVKLAKGRSYSDLELQLINSADFLFKCCNCGEEKPNSEFNKLKRINTRGRNFTGRCKACRDKKKTNEYNSSEKRRKYMVKRQFGLEYEDYLKLHESQDSCCAICGIAEIDLASHKSKRLCVDHNHDTGKVRGLLCYKCNVAIGMLNDSPILLSKALDYLNFNN